MTWWQILLWVVGGLLLVILLAFAAFAGYQVLVMGRSPDFWNRTRPKPCWDPKNC